MVTDVFSRIISSWFVFALPLFRSFQALQRRPASDADVERLTKYWIVIGAIMTYEYSVEFLVSWFPFYWELKLLLLLFISLPQLQGSTYVYDTWLAPFLSQNESQIDHQIQDAQENFLEFFQSRVQTVLDKILGRAPAPGSEASPGQEADERPPSTFQNAARMAMSYLTAHGLSLAGGGDAVRPAGSRVPSGGSRPASFASASSTSVQQATSANDINPRSGPVSESQSRNSFAITPEEIYQSQASKQNVPNNATPPAFPQPEHF